MTLTLADFLAKAGKLPTGPKAPLASPSPADQRPPAAAPPVYWNLAPVVVFQVIHTTCEGCGERTVHTNPIPHLMYRGRKGEVTYEAFNLHREESERLRLFKTHLNHMEVTIPRCHACIVPDDSPDFLAIQPDLFH